MSQVFAALAAIFQSANHLVIILFFSSASRLLVSTVNLLIQERIMLMHINVVGMQVQVCRA